MPSPEVIPVSVVIPAYNRGGLIARTLSTVAAQTAPPAEVIVVDDCSSDDTGVVAAAYGARVIRHDENRGAAAARNTGLAAAEHEWVALLDSDDEWLPHHLAAVWAARDGHVLVSGSSLHLDARDRPMRTTGPVGYADRVVTTPEELLYPENPITASGVLARADAIHAVGGYDTTLRHAEDFDLWTRLLRHGSACCLARVTLIIRHHAGQKSKQRTGAGTAQRTIAERVVGDSPLARRRRGILLWDDARAHLRAGERGAAARDIAALARSPRGVLGVAGVFAWRRLIRRRARRLTPEGRERVAVLPGAAAPAGSGAVEDWSAMGPGARARALAVSPPWSAAAARPLDRMLCRLTRVPEPALAVASLEVSRGRTRPPVLAASPTREDNDRR